MNWFEITQLSGRISAIDILRVWSGSLAASRILLPRSSMARLSYLLADSRLSLVVGCDDVLQSNDRSSPLEVYTRAVANAHSGAAFVYIGKDTRAAERLRRYDEAGLGLEYCAAAGIPTCCAVGAYGM